MTVRLVSFVLSFVAVSALGSGAMGQVADQPYPQEGVIVAVDGQPCGEAGGFGWGHGQDPLSKFVKSMVRDWKRNNCWPEPFPCPDRQHVRAPFVTMVENGWRRQNLLSGFHFDVDSGALNPAGEEKLRSILTEIPEHHRTVYVSRGQNAQETADRIAAVQKVAAQIAPDGPVPAIVETSISAGGWSAERVDAISRKFQETTPEPRLPKGDASGSAPK